MKGKERRSFSNGKRIEWWGRGGWRGRHIPESNPFSSKGLCLCLVTQLCPTLWDPTDCSPSGSSVHGIFQARILERVAIPSSRGSSQPRDQPMIPASPALQADSLLLRQRGRPGYPQSNSQNEESLPTLSYTLEWKEASMKLYTCTPVFIAALFIIARTWKKPRAHQQTNGQGSCGTYTPWNITQPLKRIHLNQF